MKGHAGPSGRVRPRRPASAGARCVGVASLGDRRLLRDADLVIDDFVGWNPSAVVAAVVPAERTG